MERRSKKKSETVIVKEGGKDIARKISEEVLPASSKSIITSKRYSITNELLFSNKIISNTSANKKMIKGKSGEIEIGGESEDEKLSLDIFHKEYENYPLRTISDKNFNIIKSYGMNSHIGLYKPTNEDKIVFVNHVKKPANLSVRNWPKVSYFAIFDGHGGETCAEFLKTNLLGYILEMKEFLQDTPSAIKKGLDKAQTEFFKRNEGKPKEEWDNSGSCALVIIIIDNKIYCANIGDSRALLSMEEGKKIKPLSIDHKPNNPKEYERIIRAGGKVFLDQDDITVDEPEKLHYINSIKEFDEYCGDSENIFREYPSDMACSRSIGDYPTKIKDTPYCFGSISSEPEIISMDHFGYYDFIIMGCDGIYDNLSNYQVVDAAWYIIKKLEREENHDPHKLAGDVCDMIIKYAMSKDTEDNLSCIFIAFEGVEKFLKTDIAKEKIKGMGGDKKKGK